MAAAVKLKFTVEVLPKVTVYGPATKLLLLSYTSTNTSLFTACTCKLPVTVPPMVVVKLAEAPSPFALVSMSKSGAL